MVAAVSAERDRKLVHDGITSSKRGNLRSDHHGRRSRCQGLPSHFPMTPVGRGTAEVSAMICFMLRNVIWNPFRGGFPQKWNETGRRKARNDNNKDELTKCRHMVRWLFGRLRMNLKRKKKSTASWTHIKTFCWSVLLQPPPRNYWPLYLS